MDLREVAGLFLGYWGCSGCWRLIRRDRKLCDCLSYYESGETGHSMGLILDTRGSFLLGVHSLWQSGKIWCGEGHHILMALLDSLVSSHRPYSQRCLSEALSKELDSDLFR